MKAVTRLLDRFFPPIELIKPGIYHYQAPPEASLPYRLHLRIDSNGESTLIVNASTVLHLNQTASEYAYHIVNQTPVEDIAGIMSKRYNIDKNHIQSDYDAFLERMHTLVETPDLDPVTFLDFDRTDPYGVEPAAPYRLDCALTYQVHENVDPSAAPQERVKKELDTQDWKTIQSKAWQAGIPHIIFTGGEPTLRQDLSELIKHSEQLGQVTGLLTDGLKLTDAAYLDELLQSGLDHLMIVLDANNEASWKSIATVTPQDIHTTVHLTITPENKNDILDIIERLAQLEINALSISSSSASLNETMNAARQSAGDAGISLKWDLPVPYSNMNPVALELEKSEKPVDGAGTGWMYIEPDGDVLAAQGLTEVLGNLLSDDWQTIWENRKR